MGQSVIEINGTKYDATTGKVMTAIPKTSQRGSNIDGIVSTSASKPTPVSLVPKPKQSVSHSDERKIHNISTVHANRTNRSKTLMRSVVKKPGTSIDSPSKLILSNHQTTLTPSPSYASTSTRDARLHKALSTPTNNLIKRFTHPSALAGTSHPTLVHNMPVALQTSQQSSQQTSHETPQLHVAKTIQLSSKASPASRFVDSQLSKVATEAQQSPFKKKAIHKRAIHKIASNKLRSFAAGSMAVLLIGGFLVYQNLPSITLVFANRDAGITAKIPKGVPSNFALSADIKNSHGQIVLSFNSRVDDRQFRLTQIKADTTTESLRETVARITDNQYQTYETNGITLFLSANDRVDWLDGGMHYNIIGTTGFSPDQIATIASSL